VAMWSGGGTEARGSIRNDVICAYIEAKRLGGVGCTERRAGDRDSHLQTC